MRRRLLALTVVSLLVFGTAACGDQTGKADTTSPSAAGTGQDIAGLTVTGDFGTVPSVKISTPLKVEKPSVEVITTGEGNPVVEGEKTLLHLYLANGTTGKKAAATYDQGKPAELQMSEEALFPAVVQALVGQPQGSRVAIADSVKNVYGAAGAEQLGLKAADTAVFVVDIMSVQPKTVLDGPEGTTVAPPKGLPTVVDEDGKVTGLDFAEAPAKAPAKFEVVPLIEGDGPPARDDSLVTFNYFGQVWGADKQFDESFSKAPVPFSLGIGNLIKGWDEGLVGVKAGSRVMIIAPPEYGYGAAGNPQGGIKKNATLVFVVDVLGVDA